MWSRRLFLRARLPRQIDSMLRRSLVRSASSSAAASSTSNSSSTAATTAPSSSSNSKSDRLLVVGSGVAGSAAALVAAEVYQIPVTMLFAGSSGRDCNSYWAQGGIIYRNFNTDSVDSPELLMQDIFTAGAGLCHGPAVHKVAHEGPKYLERLLLSDREAFCNVPFDRTPSGELSMCLEASHAAPRILHYADHTGKVITEHLVQACARHPLITLQGDTIVTDLVVDEQTTACVGVKTISTKHPSSSSSKQRPQSLYASRGVVLASGGLAGIYKHSTNPSGFNALGSSVALAARRNVSLKDLEYVQFHPTALNIPDEPAFLLTEALRGEGGVLRNDQGRAFCKDVHPLGELAPRDIVARAVFQEAQRRSTATTGGVFLDMTHRDAEFLERRFPTIQQHIAQYNLNLSRDWLPVSPAAHYTCGGVQTDLHGRTTLPNLYAAGEAARTGLHGGNRLASTSLLEGLVFGASVAEHVGNNVDAKAVHEEVRVWLETTGAGDAGEVVNGTHKSDSSSRERTKYMATELLEAVRKTMWDHVGVVRTSSGLATALEELDQYKMHAVELFEEHPTPESSGVRDAAFAGHAVAQAAMQNRVSVGAHCILDDEESDDSEEEEEELTVAAAAMQ